MAIATTLSFRDIMTPIYLDNNSTTALHPDVAAAMQECYLAGFANSASQHSFGRKARRIVEDARDQIAALLGAETAGMHADRVIFTSGGTEANNLAIRGLAGITPGSILISAIEHPSVISVAEHLVVNGFQVVQLEVDNQGIVQVAQLHDRMGNDIRLVSAMLGNNETGVLQPVAEIAAICRSRGVPVHTDAVQAVGKIPVHFRSLGVDALSFSAHKFHGPGGIGGIVLRHDVSISPILFGGFQQAGLRPGTEPVALIVGLLRALQIAIESLGKTQAKMSRLRDHLAALLRAGFPELVVNGEGAIRLPHTLNVGFPGLNRQALAMALDLAGVACSTGSACASGSSELSPVLLAMGLPMDVIEGSIRFSLSAAINDSEVDEAASRILTVVNDLRRRGPAQRRSVPPPLVSPKPL